MAYSYIQKEKEAYQIFAVSCGYELLKLITLGQTISLFSTFDLSTFSTTLSVPFNREDIKETVVSVNMSFR